MRALALVSGGLDSVLAARLIMEQGLDVLGVSFTSPFFDAEGAAASCEEIGIDLVVIDIGEDLLRIIDAPKHGFGKHMNPCIDCHALMVRRAGGKMDELGASFVVTGEVVGQRPKSQMRFGLQAVERESGLKGLLLRPLSAKLLPATVPETEGWVDRERLLGLHGRSRKPQMELASRLGVTVFASPAGGCLLTDENYARVFLDVREHEEVTLSSVRLIALGRQFRLPGGSRLAVGRNHAENESLFELALDASRFVKAVDHKGPVGVLLGSSPMDDAEIAARIVARYCDAPGNEAVRIRVWDGDADGDELEVTPLSPREVRRYSI